MKKKQQQQKHQEEQEKAMLTPTLAQKLLETIPVYEVDGYGQRPLRERKAQGYANQMTAGTWEKTRSDCPIIIDWNNKMINGQHRCWGVVLSGKSIPVMIHRGVNPKVIHYIDKQATRKVSEDLAINGVKNPVAIAAGLRSISQLEYGDFHGNQSFLYDDAEDLLDKHPHIHDIASRVIAAGRFSFSGLMPSGLGIGLWTLFISKTGATKLADEFFTSLITGLNLKETDPEYVLRERMLKLSANKNERTKPIVFAAITIYAWNRKREGKTMGHVCYNMNNPFPEIV